MVEQGREEEINKDWVKENLGIDNVYCGGAPGLSIEWLPIGTAFMIEEDGGSETLITIDSFDLIA